MRGAAVARLVQAGEGCAVNAAEIRRWDLAARARYAYAPDAPGTNPWRSFADDVLAGRAWRGQCADLASTVLDLCDRAGAGLSGQFRLVVIAQGTSTPDHMIAAQVDDASGVWIVGDTFGSEPYPAEDCPHTAVRYQRMEEAMPDNIWHVGAPWTASSGLS